MNNQGTMTIDELADKVGMKPRKVRLYIAEGVLQPPLRQGRGAPYGPEHLERLELIKRYQAEGKTLAQIRNIVLGISETGIIPVEPWSHIAVDQDLIIMARGPEALSRAMEMLKKEKKNDV